MFEQEFAEEERCDCADRSWYGPTHDTQCPAHIAVYGASRPTVERNSKPVPYWLDTLLDIKRMAEKSGDREADPFALLNLIACEVRRAINKATNQ